MEESLREIAECCICTNLFNDPRMLPCIHTFCLNCLNEMSAKTQLRPGDSMPCPLCRTSFVIPPEGMAGLKRNFFIERLVEVTKISKPSERLMLCDNCTEEREAGGEVVVAEVPSATEYCIQCRQQFCERCCREHKRFKHFKGHQLVVLGSPVREELMRKFEMQYCEQHTKEQAKLYCSKCEQVICMMCFAEEHNTHKCTDVEKVAEMFRQKIANDIGKLSSHSNEALLQIQKIVNTQKDLQIKVEEAEKDIIRKANELKKIVDECTKSLLDELSLIKQQASKKLETIKEESERHIASIESLEAYCNELISKGSSAEICRSVHDLSSRSEYLQKTHLQHIQQQLPSIRFSFEASKSNEFLKAENIVGVIKGDKNSDGTRTPTQVQQVAVVDFTPGLNKYPYKRREFFIVSEMNGKVLDIKKDSLVVVCSKKTPRSKSQVWYFDQHGVIHSALNDFVLDCPECATPVQLKPYLRQNHQQWTFFGNKIISKTWDFLDIRRSDDRNGAVVISYVYWGTANQHWRPEFLEEPKYNTQLVFVN